MGNHRPAIIQKGEMNMAEILKVAGRSESIIRDEIENLLRRVEALSDTLWQALNPDYGQLPQQSTREVVDIIHGYSKEALGLMEELKEEFQNTKKVVAIS